VIFAGRACAGALPFMGTCWPQCRAHRPEIFSEASPGNADVLFRVYSDGKRINMTVCVLPDVERF
jgi:hypothetical protein